MDFGIVGEIFRRQVGPLPTGALWADARTTQQTTGWMLAWNLEPKCQDFKRTDHNSLLWRC